MNRYALFFLLICLFLEGCGVSKSVPTAIRIDNITVSSDEFETAFKNSPFSSENTPRARKEFLDYFVTKTLMLRQAEKTGLDKDPAFLKGVEQFWQQSLIKLVLDNKIRDLSVNMAVTDGEIKDYYNARKLTDYAGNELPAVYDNIRWMILNQKQKEAVSAWSQSLKENAKVDIDYKLLKLDE